MYEYIDREIAEAAWIETLDLMAEFNISPDYDAQVKQHDIEVIEAGLPVVEMQTGEDNLEPF